LTTHPPRLNDRDLIRDAIERETRFSANGYRGTGAPPDCVIMPGNFPILVSAPHAVSHPRHGSLKVADVYTGSLALQLASEFAAPAIALASTGEEDPNYDETSEYKDLLGALAHKHGSKFVLDLHGMARDRPWDLAIGTANGRSLGARADLREVLVTSLEAAGFCLLIDDPRLFSASNPNTIARWTQAALRLPAIQLEINRMFRGPAREPGNYSRLFQALRRAIEQLGRAIEPLASAELAR
jgi:phage replication-related protein YjqB (UPF0714/DUF867 family)